MNLDEITKKFAAELSDFEKKHGTINGGFATGLARKYAIEAYNQAINDAACNEDRVVDDEFNETYVGRNSILKLKK